jgi:hypothetical protein
MKAESMQCPQSISVDYVKSGQARINCCMNIEEVQFYDEDGTPQVKYTYDYAYIKWAMPSASHISRDAWGNQIITSDGLAYLDSIKSEILAFAAATL